jgi:hypothetical protein
VVVLTPASLLATWERGSGEPPLLRALTLLEACTGHVRDDAALVDVGSRDAVLAALLARMAGGPMWACVDCGGCGSPLDVQVDLAAVASLPTYEPGEIFATGTVTFRLPTTADLAALSGCEPAQARRLLLDRCIRRTDETLPEDVAEEVAEDVAEAVEAAMESVAPAGAVGLSVRCGQCGSRTEAALDVPALLWAEVEAQASRLVGDMHELAAAYGWTEADVLALSPRRRAAYLELVGA